MPQQQGQLQWLWHAEIRKWYYYDARTDEIVFEDQQRVPRPSHVPRTSFPAASTIPASAADYSQDPTKPGHGYDYDRSQHSASSQPRTHSIPRVQQSVRPGLENARPRNSSTDNANQALPGLALRPAQITTQNTAAAPRSGPRVTTARGDGIFSARNEENQVQTVVRTEPRERITDPALAQAGIWARSLLLETPGDVEQLFDSYRRRDTPRKYFIFGRVFFVLWAEPHGDSSTAVTGLERGTSLNSYGEPVYSKARRFVVIREADDYCTCLPILTYQEQGVAKRGVRKSEHSIIYTSKTPPPPRPNELPQRGEDGMQPDAIRVNADNPADKLSDISRLDYGKTYTIHHNLKVKNVGVVNPNSRDDFLRQFNNVWTRPRSTEGSGLHAIGEPGSSRGGNASNAPAPLRRGDGRQEPAAEAPLHNQRSRRGTDSRTHVQGQARRPSQERHNDDSSSSDGSEEANNVPAQARLRASAQAAMQRMIARGFTPEEAATAFRRETKRLSQRRPAQPNDEEQDAEASSSEEDDEIDVRSNPRSRGSQGRSQHGTRRQSSSHTVHPNISGHGPSTKTAPVPQSPRHQAYGSGSTQTQQMTKQPLQQRQHPQQAGSTSTAEAQKAMRQGPPPRQDSRQALAAGTNLTQQPGGQVPPPRQDSRPTTGVSGGAAAAASQQPGRQAPPPRQESRQSGTGTSANPGRAPQPSTSVSTEQLTTAERAEQAVQRLMVQGYSREQAIAIVRRHIGGSGRG